MKYLFYAIVFDVAGNTTPVGSSTSPSKTITTNIQKVTGISINPSSAQTKNIGDTFKITATVSPSDANNKSVTWSSSNTSIATVDSSGNVRCVSAGTTTITATAADGSGVKAQLSLTVRNPINNLTLDKDQTTILKDGYTSTVTATTDPANYDGANISWTIADTSIATVSVSGKTATIKSTSKVGQTTLTVSAGGITKTVNVSVVNFTTQTYSYTGTVQQVDLPAGTYKLECWGASGADTTGNSSMYGGKGGYSFGKITLTSNTTIYVYVGGKGGNCLGGWNGGATGRSYSSTNSSNTGGGGGATDISLYGINESTDYNNTNHLYSRIIVAGGGGGSAANSNSNGGIGGGSTGGNPGSGYGTVTGGSQTSCGSGGCANGKFGIGGTTSSCGGWTGGGGGGWYGGNMGNTHGGGSGGSGYVYTASNATNYPSGCLLNSSYYLMDAQTIAGDQSFPNVAGTGNETGHSGNGAAKITPVN